jgi:hypothetical protein
MQSAPGENTPKLREMKATIALSTCVLLTSLVMLVSAQNTQTTDPKTGDVTTTGASDKYGEGGTHTTVADKDGNPLSETYTDKQGKVREKTMYGQGTADNPAKTSTTFYFGSQGNLIVQVIHRIQGDEYHDFLLSQNGREVNSDRAKWLIKKAAENPPEKTAEKPKEEPKKDEPKIKREATGGGLPISGSQFRVETTGTGETIGHVADLVVQNLTDQTIECSIPPMILESRSGKNQTYACPEGQTVELKPHELKTIPMDGVCVNRDKPPVGRGVAGDLAMNDGTLNVGQDVHVTPKNTDKLLRLCEAKYHAADKLQKDGELKDLPYHDKQMQKDIVVQWSTWTDPRICEITGAPPATRDDLKKVVYKQLPHPMSSNEKKKIDHGIDTIFEKIELTSEKAKDLEKPGLYEEPLQPRGEPVGMPTPGTGTTERPTAAPTPESTASPTPTSTPTAGTEEKKPTVSKPLQKPCPDGKLLVRHAYSECGPDNFWHVVEDAYYNCPPVKSFRVFDFQTDQKCTAGQAPPSGLVGPAYKEFLGGSSDCQSPKPTDEFIYVSECIGGFWAMKTYRVYECLDGSKRIKSPPEHLEQSTTECTKPPPAPPH